MFHPSASSPVLRDPARRVALTRLLGGGLLIATGSIAGSARALAGTSADLWLERGSGLEVDYAPWAAFLAHYVRIDQTGLSRVAYGRVSAADKAALTRFVTRLEDIDVARMTAPQQFAFWVNLYNAVTVQVVLGAYPVDSIRDISGGLFSRGPWRQARVSMNGQKLSLDDIEHGILRPVFKDPRVHFAVNCASVGCPNLAAVPFRADTLEAQLDAAARSYINSPRGLRASGSGASARLVVSSIFDWYAEDFGGNAQGVLAYVRRFASPQTRAMLERFSTIADYEYDWSLNDDR